MKPSDSKNSNTERFLPSRHNGTDRFPPGSRKDEEQPLYGAAHAKLVRAYVYRHATIFVAAHIACIFLFGLVPPSDLPAGSYEGQFLQWLLSGKNGYFQNDFVNKISSLWMKGLIVHAVGWGLWYTVFPKQPPRDTTQTERINRVDTTRRSGRAEAFDQTNHFNQYRNEENTSRTHGIDLANRTQKASDVEQRIKTTPSVDAYPAKDVQPAQGMQPAEDMQPAKGVQRLSTGRAWLFVCAGGLLEIFWASQLKTGSIGLLTVIAMLGSFDLLVRAAKAIPIGTVYAVFAGIGASGTILADMFFFHEPISLLKIALILLLTLFIIGLKLTGDTGRGAA